MPSFDDQVAVIIAVRMMVVVVRMVVVRMIVMMMVAMAKFFLLLVAVVLVPLEHEGVVPSAVIMVAVLMVRREKVAVVGSVQREVTVVELPGSFPLVGLEASHILIPCLILRLQRSPRQYRPSRTQSTDQPTTAPTKHTPAPSGPLHRTTSDVLVRVWDCNLSDRRC